MANEENGAGQEPQPGTPAPGQEPNAPQNEPEGQASKGEASPKEFDLEQITDPATRAYVERQIKDAQEARQEAARYRTERKGLQNRVTEMERAGESEAEKAERERQERDAELEGLREKVRDMEVGGAVRDAAAKANAHNPERVWGIIRERVELGDDGKPTNVGELVTELKRTDPYLFRRTEGDAGAGRSGEASPSMDMNALIRRSAGRG